MKMKKFLNSPENLTDELLEGLAGAYPDKIRLEEGRIVVRAVPESRDKVAGDNDGRLRTRARPQRICRRGNA